MTGCGHFILHEAFVLPLSTEPDANHTRQLLAVELAHGWLDR